VVKMFESKLDFFLSERELRNATIGAEMEVYVLDDTEYPPIPLQSSEVIEDIYSQFDERVYRDYYTYQLEIRTRPSDDPNEVAKELCQLLNQVSKVVREYQCFIAPVSYIIDDFEDTMFCGFHIHISLDNNNHNFTKMCKIMLAMYPLIYDIARISLSSPVMNKKHGEILSKRVAYSNHIGIIPPPYDLETLERRFISERERYYDIAINTNRRDDEDDHRHRIKNIDTIEIRVFDSCGSRKAIETIINATYQLARKVKTDFIKEISYNIIKQEKFAEMLITVRRRLIDHQKYFNPITLSDLPETLEKLEVKTQIFDAWIKYEFWDWYLATNPKFHKKISYPI